MRVGILGRHEKLMTQALQIAHQLELQVQGTLQDETALEWILLGVAPARVSKKFS